MKEQRNNEAEIKITADYPKIPDHSDLRGFSYHAPENFDFRDERAKPKEGFWQSLVSRLGGGGNHAR